MPVARLEKKLDEASLETLYQSFRSNERWSDYSNEQLIDAILRKRTNGSRGCLGNVL